MIERKFPKDIFPFGHDTIDFFKFINQKNKRDLQLTKLRKILHACCHFIVLLPILLRGVFEQINLFHDVFSCSWLRLKLVFLNKLIKKIVFKCMSFLYNFILQIFYCQRVQFKNQKNSLTLFHPFISLHRVNILEYSTRTGCVSLFYNYCMLKTIFGYL